MERRTGGRREGVESTLTANQIGRCGSAGMCAEKKDEGGGSLTGNRMSPAGVGQKRRV